MAKKIIGYTELRWICPNCQTNNLGKEESCIGCGAPQPEDVVFFQPEEQILITDQEKINQAKAGADLHCGFCGTRNPAGATNCSQCGSDLSSAKKRAEGTVVGAYVQVTPGSTWICDNCQSVNIPAHAFCTACGAPRRVQTPAPAPTPPAPLAQPLPAKRSWRSCLVPGLILAGVVVLAIFIISLLSRNEEMTGYVSGMQWTRSVALEAFGPVNRSDWSAEIPAAADIGLCELRYSHTQDNPAPRATEVCGTPYTVDLGNGMAEVVQDCSYRVYAEYCQYTIDDWQVVDTLELSGAGLNPQWPEHQLAGSQRFADYREQYVISFMTDEGIYQYTTSDVGEYQAFSPGSEWVLTINAFNRVSEVEPVR